MSFGFGLPSEAQGTLMWRHRIILKSSHSCVDLDVKAMGGAIASLLTLSFPHPHSPSLPSPHHTPSLLPSHSLSICLLSFGPEYSSFFAAIHARVFLSPLMYGGGIPCNWFEFLSRKKASLNKDRIFTFIQWKWRKLLFGYYYNTNVRNRSIWLYQGLSAEP